MRGKIGVEGDGICLRDVLVGSNPGSACITQRVDREPLYVIALHRFAREGLADLYTPSKRFVGFIVTDILRSKWPALKDAEKVFLRYNELPGDQK